MIRWPFPKGGTYLALYSSHPVSLEAAAKAVAGKIPLSGRLPVTIPDMYPLGHGHRPGNPSGVGVRGERVGIRIRCGGCERYVF